MNSVYSPGSSFQPIPRRWSTLSGSALLHVGVIGGVIALAGAAAGIVAPPVETDLTYVHLAPPPLELPQNLPPVVKREVKYVETPPEPTPEPPKPVEEKVVAKAEPTPAPEPPREKAIEPPKPAPKQLTVGSFDPAGNSTRAPEAARPVVTAGFDQSAARTPDMKTAAAAVGGFEQARAARPGTDRPNVVGDAGFGAGVSTGKGRGGAGGTVQSGGFGSATAGGGGGRPAGAVKTTDFDAQEARHIIQQRQVPKDTPLEILSKPVPAYTDEARAMQIEGEVLLDVEFGAAGEIRVVRVVRGLGHGLDESAVRAVKSMRFKPAQRDGQPVDFRTTVNIVFRLA